MHIWKRSLRAPSYSTSVEINGEDARQFLAGFADNIGLENVRAATIVSAAVAARTRSSFLQAWALEMQGKHNEAKLEMSKMCLLLRIFPPDESSPQMEMVARGLEKHLKQEQREHLMDVFAKVCGDDSHRIAREALGLPQMEMVARGLEKHLELEQREHLMDVFAKVCGDDSHRIAREALGLSFDSVLPQFGFYRRMEKPKRDPLLLLGFLVSCKQVRIQCNHDHNVILLNHIDYMIFGQVGIEIGVLNQLQTIG
ncbi:hypothetical protein L6164_013452 [Bauhinia variegata]|uniref:Uncharacterized protein n=1 Tax=Bauhinia variegata TaxID=167791 RepID=A0ACB9NF49_BAUVA|nr:hypothetical protein L6164_013452 [Bauhinia variegata]